MEEITKVLYSNFVNTIREQSDEIKNMIVKMNKITKRLLSS